MKTVRDIIVVVVGLVVLFVVINRRPGAGTVTVQTDTVYVRDTIREPVPAPYAVYITRVDTVTVFVPVPARDTSAAIADAAGADSMRVDVPLPIEEKEYRTPDYYAVVRGFRPELVRLDLFPENRVITQRITRRPRWGIGIQAGYGFTPRGVHPYIGIGIQYNLFTF